MLHNTILKYIALIKSVFNGLTITHKDKHNRLISHTIPMFYGRSEKSLFMQAYSEDQVKKGNTHVIPCGYISLDALSKADDRMTNKNRITNLNDAAHEKYSYNSVPYDFVFSIDIRCRGASDAYQIVEQVAPMFNPTVNLDVWDSLYGHKPTRVPLVLDGIDVEAPDYDENSTNIYTVSFACTLKGWIYQPVLHGSTINNTILNMAFNEDSYASIVDNETVLNSADLKFNIIDIVRDSNKLTAITDCSNELVIQYDWAGHNASVTGQGDHATVAAEGDYAVTLTLTNQFGASVSMTKHFKSRKFI